MKWLWGAPLVAALVIGTAASVSAQEYPSRTVTIVVPFASGGTIDIFGRMIGQRLAQRWGKAVIIENRPGAGGSLGTSLVAKAKPDGHTLLMGSAATLAINATLLKNLSYDLTTDLVPLAMVATSDFALVVAPNLPFRSVADLVSYARANPGKLTYGSSGMGTSHHLFMEQFKLLTDTQITHVPYRGSAPALVDVIGGQVSAMFTDIAPALDMIQSGKLRTLAVSSARRTPALPGAPTIAEAGVPGYSAVSWLMVAAPSQIPEQVVRRLHSDLNEIAAAADFQEWVTAKTGLVPADNMSIEELRKFVRSEIERWGAVVKRAGITIEQ